MSPPAATPANPHDLHPGSDIGPKRRLTVLCVVYLVLGVVASGHFFFTDFQTVLDEHHAATVEFADSQARLADPINGNDLTRAADDETPVDPRRDLQLAGTKVRRVWGRLGGFGAGLLIVTAVLVLNRRRFNTTAEVTNAASLMIALLGVVLLASRLLVQRAVPSDVVGFGIVDIVVLQLVAAAIMPWSAKEVTLPFGLLLLVWAVTFLVPRASDMEILDRVVIVILSSFLLLPGAGLAEWRRRRREEDAERLMLGRRVESFGGELSRARIVHDAMFPPAFTGHVAFEYEYQPIAEIGGDYVHTHVCSETGRVTLTLLDVAGHGLAAALTVNRLFGELERILAETPDAEPGELMRLLNRYINLTMARHSLFATGTSMMLDPTTGELKWVSAGHPPSLLRTSDGKVKPLDTTTLLLGVHDRDEFEPRQRSTTMSPGDVVIAYTDGAFEARGIDGERFGLARVEETARFHPPPRSWPKFIAGAVSKHHDGHAEDDVLIAALTLRSLRIAEAEPLTVSIPEAGQTKR